MSTHNVKLTDFKDWMESELSKVKESIVAIPASERKGAKVALLRSRAREFEAARNAVKEFELLNSHSR